MTVTHFHGGNTGSNPVGDAIFKATSQNHLFEKFTFWNTPWKIRNTFSRGVNPMATFDKRGDLQWRAQIRRKGFPVQRKTFNSRAEAEAWAAVVESEMARGIFVSRKEAENTTLAEALDRYEREVSQEKRGHTKEKDKIDHWRKSSLGSLFLASIRSSDLSKWRDERLKKASPATVNRLLNLLSHVFTVAAQDWGMGGLVNPVPNVRRPKNPLPRERRLLPGEFDRILAGTGSHALGDVIRFAIETGMRRGEIAHMKWEHVDLKKKVLLVPETKTGDPRRIPLSPEAGRILSGTTRRIDGKVWGYDEKGLGITRVFQELANEPDPPMRRNAREKGKSLIHPSWPI